MTYLHGTMINPVSWKTTQAVFKCQLQPSLQPVDPPTHNTVRQQHARYKDCGRSA